jgi:hypothetical protein
MGSGSRSLPEEIDKLQSAFVSLSESGLELDKSKEVLQDLQAIALKSGPVSTSWLKRSGVPRKAVWMPAKALAATGTK